MGKKKPTIIEDATIVSETKQEKAINIEDSPLMEGMIERTDGGGDHFEFKQEPVNNTENNSFTNNSNNYSPKEFDYDPLDEIDELEPSSSNNTNPGGADTFDSSSDTFGSNGGGSNNTSIDPQMSADMSSTLSDMILDGFGMVAPKLAESYYSINEVEIRKYEATNKLAKGSLEYVKDINKKQRGAIKFDKEKKNYIKPHLEKVLQIKGANADPVTLLIIAVITVVGMMWFSANELKKENKELIDGLVELNKREAEKTAQKQKDFEEERAKKDEVIDVKAETI